MDRHLFTVITGHWIYVKYTDEWMIKCLIIPILTEKSVEDPLHQPQSGLQKAEHPSLTGLDVYHSPAKTLKYKCYNRIEINALWLEALEIPIRAKINNIISW